MLAAPPPPLLPCYDPFSPGPGLTQEHFRALFQYLYVEAYWYATLPGGETLRVRFRPRHFDHAFFKELSRGAPRDAWQPQRAERLLWIGYAVENAVEVRRMGAGRVNLFCRMADHVTPWFVVVTDRVGADLDFLTAYPLAHHEYLQARRTGVVMGRDRQDRRPPEGGLL